MGDADKLGGLDVASPRIECFGQAEVQHLDRAVARTLMFAGFRSRWTMPASCAASSASAICFAIGSASSIGIGPRAMRCGEVLALDQFHHQRATSGLFEAVDCAMLG